MCFGVLDSLAVIDGPLRLDTIETSIQTHGRTDMTIRSMNTLNGGLEVDKDFLRQRYVQDFHEENYERLLRIDRTFIRVLYLNRPTEGWIHYWKFNEE
jgi:hypothetical protein